MAQTEPQFKEGDRAFSHYVNGWGTILKVKDTVRNQTHGVTDSKLPDSTWYDLKMDNGDTEYLDDAHGDWDMARIVPPHIAKLYGYGDDPNPVKSVVNKEPEIIVGPHLEPVNAQMRVKRTR